MRHAFDVVSLSPLRTASLLWQPRRDAFALTLVCKATFVLAPGTAELAAEQEDPNEDENHWNDDPARSVYSPSDLAPRKPCAEVMLVGHAFASPGERARSVLARVLVGEVDKSVEVFGERSFAQGGVLREGPPFSKVPLRWERASGGPETNNPVGMRLDVRDAYGVVALPNVQPPGMSVASPTDFITPAGFGPIAAAWPTRQERLGLLAGRWSERALAEGAMPEGIDPRYFMSALVDQHLPALRADERIVLEHLHAEHARLVTSLPGIEPRAFVERAGAAVQELAMVADTLWIDTDRARCTLTWRGQLPLEHAGVRGRILVGSARRGWPLAWADLEAEAALRREGRAPRADSASGGTAPPPAPDSEPPQSSTMAGYGPKGAADGPRSAGTAIETMEPADLMPDDEGATPPPVLRPTGAPRASAPGLPFLGSPAALQPSPLPAAPRPPPLAPPVAGPVLQAPPEGRARRPGALGETMDTLLPDPNVVERAVAAAERARTVVFPQAETPASAAHDASPAWLRTARGPAAPPTAPPPPPLSPPAAPATPRFGAPPPSPPVEPAAPAPVRFGAPGPPVPAPAWRIGGADAGALGVAPAPPALSTIGTFAPQPVDMPTGGPTRAATTFGQQAAGRGPLAEVAAPQPAKPMSSIDVARPAVVSPDAAKLGATAASNAAAATEVSAASAAPASGGEPSGARATRPRELVDLLWFDPALAPRLRSAAAFKELFAPRTSSEAWITTEQAERDRRGAEAEQADRDRRDALRVIGRAEPLEAARLERAFEDAFDDEGAFSPPLAVAAGELVFRFDEREALKATVTSVAPLIGGDKKLRDLVTEATEALKGEWPLPDDVADGFTRRVEQAFAASLRSVPPGYLQGSVDKLLLEGRHYRKKSVFSEPRIRAELACPGSDPIPTYLPVALAMRLPLFARFRSVLVVELRTQEDQHEAHPQALLVLAVARVLQARRGA